MSDVRYKNHNQLVNTVLVYLGSNCAGRFWPNPTGAVQTKSGHFQRYGLKGSTDIIGISGDGSFVAIEIKTGTARLSPVQKSFQEMINKYNGIYILVHNEIDESQFEILRRKL